MIQVQDAVMFDVPVEAKPCKSNITYQNNIQDMNRYLLTYEVKSKKIPEIVKPQTENISPLVTYLINKIKTGTPEEQKKCISIISRNLESKNGVQYFDTGITAALFELADSDISKYKDATLTQKRLRKKAKDGKKLSEKQMQKAYSFSEREKVECNQITSIYLIANIQNRLYKELYIRTGLKAGFYDLPAVSGLINEAKNNKNELIRIAAVSALGYMYKADYKSDFITALEDIGQTSSSPKVKEEVAKVLKYVELNTKEMKKN